MYYLYVLYSLKDHKLYKGTTADVARRFIRHNAGGNKSTAHRKPFVLIHTEVFDTKNDALKKERFYKTAQGGAELKSLLIDIGVLNSDGKLNSF
jgi:putative endonuclease